MATMNSLAATGLVHEKPFAARLRERVRWRLSVVLFFGAKLSCVGSDKTQAVGGDIPLESTIPINP